MRENKIYCRSEMGLIEIMEKNNRIASIGFAGSGRHSRTRPSVLLKKAADELEEYFQGKRKRFSFDLSQEGTVFQRRVWNELLKIPHGKTVTYKAIAQKTGCPKAVRAVGSAVGKNKIMIFVPCHRVVTSGGRLGGYAYGSRRKEWLLNREGVTGFQNEKKRKKRA